MIRVLLPDEMDDHHEARENLRSLYHGLPTSIHGQVCRNLLGSGRGGKSYFAPPDHDSPRYERVSYPRKVQYLLSVSSISILYLFSPFFKYLEILLFP